MRFEHPEHPGRGVRLAYCLNLHAAEELNGFTRGLRDVTLPLAERLVTLGSPFRFGIGPWFGASLAKALADGASKQTGGDEGRLGLQVLEGLFEKYALEPFTYNAFPYGGFHQKGLKQKVFEPAWSDPDRLRFTEDVARVARHFAAASAGEAATASHLSISTHTGGFGGANSQERAARGRGLAEAARFLRRLFEESGVRIVLGVEPEPRSHANDTTGLAAIFDDVHAVLDVEGDEAAKSHLGTCLDTCHAAVEFEEEERAYERATDGVPLAKLQFTSALSLHAPAEDEYGRNQLFHLHEDTFLHQVTGRGPEGLVRAGDLDEARKLYEKNEPGWRDAEEWRCHFHVPVDLGSLDGQDEDGAKGEPSSREAAGGSGGATLSPHPRVAAPSKASGLRTTRSSAAKLLGIALARPERWGTTELHLEIETYTWNVLPDEARRDEPLHRALEREYRHVQGLLADAGWSPAS